MTNEASAPALSVVLTTPYDFDSLRPVIGYLRAQTIRDRMEIVLVGSTPDVFRVDPEVTEGFWGHQVLHVGPIHSLNVPRAVGIRKTRAPIVALTEDHCFPAPGWAEALVRAHAGPWAGVGPTVIIANPRRFMSWANHLVQYLPWVQHTPSGVVTDLPGHNSSYKRDVLMQFDADLETIFTAEAWLHTELRRRGHQLYMDASAVAYHVYITRFRPYCQENYYIGRQFAANRGRRWSYARCLFYAAACPLLPPLRLWRIGKRLLELGWFAELVPWAVPWMCLGLGLSAAGEFMGYAFGMGPAATMTLDLDFRRNRFMSGDERARIWPGRNAVFDPDPPRPSIFRRQRAA
jgi:hypothetical protein